MESSNLQLRLEQRIEPCFVTVHEPLAREIEKTRKLAGAGMAVCLLGETGVGKSLLAHDLHLASRPGGGFVEVNCPAIPENLMESELFGHVKGSFTGAVADHKGQIEMADQGTVFLDEIADLPGALQAKLLMTTQTGRAKRVGASSHYQVVVRWIVATNANLLKLVRQGRFRMDLFYRLCEHELKIPPLRDRKEDIQELTQNFLGEQSVPVQRLSSSAWNLLSDYSWPGNTRELRAVLRRAVILADGAQITSEHLQFHNELRVENAWGASAESLSIVVGDTLQQARHKLFRATFNHCEGNISRTARMLGISPKTAYGLKSEALSTQSEMS